MGTAKYFQVWLLFIPSLVVHMLLLQPISDAIYNSRIVSDNRYVESEIEVAGMGCLEDKLYCLDFASVAERHYILVNVPNFRSVKAVKAEIRSATD